MSIDDSSTFAVESLYHPLDKETFFTKHLRGEEPYFFHGDPALYASLASLPALQNAAALCGALRAGIGLFGPGGFTGQLAVAADAMQFYNIGYTLNAMMVQRSVPELARMSELVASHLNCATTRSVEVEAFASQAGSGASMHYDFEMNFQILLRGKKRWRIAKNHHIRNPLETHFTLNPRFKVSGRDRLYVDKEQFPKEMPADCIEFEAKPGTIVFLPRGIWHETKTVEESIGVNFVVKTANWADLATTLLYERLLEDPDWRGSSIGALASEELEEVGEPYDTLARILPRFRELAQATTAADLIVASCLRRFAWIQGGEASILEKDGGLVLELAFKDGRESKVMNLTEETTDFARELVKHRRPFRSDQVMGARNAHVPAHCLPDLLETLVEGGFLVAE